MGQVCKKNELHGFYEETCRWCETPKAVEAPAARNVARRCEVLPCTNVSAWRWVAVAGEARRHHGASERFLCQGHQDTTDLKWFFDKGWQTERCAP